MNSDRAYQQDRDRLLAECRALLEARATKVVRESGVLQIFTSAPNRSRLVTASLFLRGLGVLDVALNFEVTFFAIAFS